MNTMSRWTALAAALVLGLSLAGTASAGPYYVSYYPAPAVSYYAAPATVTTTRYGLFGLRRATTVTYGSYYAAPAYSSYYAAPAYSSYYAAPAYSSYYAAPAYRSYYAAPAYSSYYAAPAYSSYYAAPATLLRRARGQLLLGSRGQLLCPAGLSILLLLTRLCQLWVVTEPKWKD